MDSLLKFSADELKEKEFKAKFWEISDHLLNNCAIVTPKNKYWICEVEFYVYHKNHPDFFTHRNPDQLLNTNWYFHRFGTKGYKSGTYKGLDLTFGSEKK